MKHIIFCSAWLGVVLLTGCQTFHDTEFSPIEARLDPTHAGGADYFVLVNSSGQTLHDFRFRAYAWGTSTLTTAGDEWATLPQRTSQQTYTFQGSGGQWEPGKVLHFRDREFGGEGKILQPISKVQIVGSCDEGSFREDWRINRSGQLEQVGVAKTSGASQ
jgi:hypothetical protein